MLVALLVVCFEVTKDVPKRNVLVSYQADESMRTIPVVLLLERDSETVIVGDGYQGEIGATLAEDPKAALPEGFSFCISVRAPAFPGHLEFGTLVDPTGDLWFKLSLIGLGVDSVGSGGGSGETAYSVMLDRDEGSGSDWGSRIGSGELVYPMEWVRVCVGIDTSTGLLRVVANGKLVIDTVDFKSGNVALKGRTPLKDLTGMFFGQWPILYGGLIMQEFTQLEVFSSVLPVAHMVPFTTAGTPQCGWEGKGDYLAWADTKWTLAGGAVMGKVAALIQKFPKIFLLQNHLQLFQDEPCVPTSNFRLYTLSAWEFQQAVDLCKNIGEGWLPPVRRSPSFPQGRPQKTGLCGIFSLKNGMVHTIPCTL